MSLSKRGQIRASLVAPGGSMCSFFHSITHDWRPDFTGGISQLDISENDLMEKELSNTLKIVLSASEDNWLSPPGPITPSSSQKLLDSCSIVINRFFRPHARIHPNQLVAGAGCSLLLEAVARVICDPNDIILTPGPIWPLFTTLLSKADVFLSIVPSSIKGEGRSISVIDALQELESLLDWTNQTQCMWEHHYDQLLAEGKKPRAILITNPQNPLGRYYPRSFLIRALEFCQKHDLFLISDEVFALSQHQNLESSYVNSVMPSLDREYIPRFNSVLSVDLENEVECDPARIIVLWSVSKDFGATRTRLAVAVTSSYNTEVKSALLSLGPSFRVSSLADSFFSAFFTAIKRDFFPDLLSSTSSEAKLGRHERDKLRLGNEDSLLNWYVQENIRRLFRGKQRFQKWCNQREIPYLEADAGHFLMLYFGRYLDQRVTKDAQSLKELEREFYTHLLSHNVALQPGLSAGCPRAGWFRATFSRDESYMDVALSRLDLALASW